MEFLKNAMTKDEKKTFIDEIEKGYFENEMSAQDVMKLIDDIVYVDKLRECALYTSFPDFEHRVWRMYCKAERCCESGE